ncbi:MAG: hypothetical protein WC728_00935 [Elusimicrobiota bacterium]
MNADSLLRCCFLSRRFVHVSAFSIAMACVVPVSADAGQTADVKRSTTAKAGWVREGEQWQCYKGGKATTRFAAKGPHTWDTGDPNTHNTLVSVTSDSSHVALFDYNRGTTTLKYFGSDCRPLFERKLPGKEVFEAHLLLGGARLLLALSDPTDGDIEQFVPAGDVLLLADDGRELLRLGKYPYDQEFFFLTHGGLYAKSRIQSELRSGQLFLDIQKGQHYIQWSDQPPEGEGSVSADGKITFVKNEFFYPDGRPIEDSVSILPPGYKKKIKALGVYQFPNAASEEHE